MSPWIHELNAVAGAWADAAWRASWQGGVAIGLVWAIGRAFPKLPGKLRCWLWRLAYLKLLAAFLWTDPISIPVLPAARNPVVAASPESRTRKPVAIFNQPIRDGERASLGSPSIGATEKPIAFSTALFVFWLLEGVAKVSATRSDLEKYAENRTWSPLWLTS